MKRKGQKPSFAQTSNPPSPSKIISWIINFLLHSQVFRNIDYAAKGNYCLLRRCCCCSYREKLFLPMELVYSLYTSPSVAAKEISIPLFFDQVSPESATENKISVTRERERLSLDFLCIDTPPPP